MYVPRSFAENESGALWDFMDAHPFATLITSAGGLFATHLPLVLQRERGGSGVLEGHVARANVHHKLASNPAGTATDALVLFVGANAHVTPTWYPSKEEHGRTVPTWNYDTVHAYGTVQFLDDTSFLRRHLAELTARHEPVRGSSWTAEDAPADYMEQQLRAIVGVQIVIGRMEGKWKMSQNRDAADVDGVINGLRSTGVPMDAQVAQSVEEKASRRAAHDTAS